MHPEIYVGYTVYRKKYGPVWVALHSGPSVRNVPRDDNSDRISSMCWERDGGTLVISNMTRDMLLGIDFNREMPSQEKAIEMYHKFFSHETGDFEQGRKDFRSKYAFVAANRKNYADKARIYKSLWSLVRNSGDFIIFIHRQYARMRNYPSAIDLITFNDCGIKKEILKKIVDDINESYSGFFRKIEKDFKNVTYVEQIKRVGLASAGADSLKGDLSIIDRNSEQKYVEKLRSDFNEKNFIMACGSAIKRMPPPEITMERIFSAESAIGPKKEIIKNRNKVAIEVEINAFMSEWFPEETAKIITCLAEKIRMADEYKKMGLNQTQILKFIS